MEVAELDAAEVGWLRTSLCPLSGSLQQSQSNSVQLRKEALAYVLAHSTEDRQSELRLAINVTTGFVPLIQHPKGWLFVVYSGWRTSYMRKSLASANGARWTKDSIYLLYVRADQRGAIVRSSLGRCRRREGWR